jgi:predicted metalloprotease with PDZ domain
LVAMDGDRVEAASFNDRFNEKKIGASAVFTVSRRDQLRNITVTVGKEEPVTYSIKEKPDATEMQKRILMSWLGEKGPK